MASFVVPCSEEHCYRFRPCEVCREKLHAIAGRGGNWAPFGAAGRAEMEHPGKWHVTFVRDTERAIRDQPAEYLHWVYDYNYDPDTGRPVRVARSTVIQRAIGAIPAAVVKPDEPPFEEVE